MKWKASQPVLESPKLCKLIQFATLISCDKLLGHEMEILGCLHPMYFGAYLPHLRQMQLCQELFTDEESGDLYRMGHFKWMADMAGIGLNYLFFHEFTHVKQFVSGKAELRGTRIFYLGERVETWKSDSPVELEAIRVGKALEVEFNRWKLGLPNAVENAREILSHI